ncbi:complex I subunit 1/NuoH family protein [Prosthecobacter dejongeii]|uniref:NADH-quinone oxidoreductase subunit H n=1 Tax=Prosthecobacter dejongeii TaxID=48465 RepID=A0A7W7YKY1_9BACT|nr:complex I subunit 1 family protein [Prosthecobacter dejongeii]MBB5038116.1 NADH-quinone oxidoreductase subunit H [Prosthecobacter dejongeii]
MAALLASFDFAFLITSVVKIVFLTFLVILPMVAYSVYAERRFSAIIQDRVGPNRTGIPLTLFGFKKDIQIFGIGGLVQPMADGLKFLLKEDFTPKSVNTFYYWLAPALTMVPALMTCAVLPFGSELDFSFLNPMIEKLGGTGFSAPVKSVIADLNVGPLFTFAIASLGVYGIVLAGWSSNSKYPFLGGVRSSAQMISYELSLGLSIIPVLMVFGELNLSKMSAFQDANGWLLLPFWGEGLTAERWVLLVPMVISFCIFTVAMFAETNRLPFDLAECETELVAGYHTEYSSMKFALFFLGEYAAMIIGSGLAVTLFLGGWSIPFWPFFEYVGNMIGLDTAFGWLGSSFQLHYSAGSTPFWLGLLHIGVFFLKVIVFILFFILIRWSLPRFRFDQLMKLGWLFMFELALANVILTAVIMACFTK